MYAIFKVQSFNNTLTNDIFDSFEQLGPGFSVTKNSFDLL